MLKAKHGNCKIIHCATLINTSPFPKLYLVAQGLILLSLGVLGAFSLMLMLLCTSLTNFTPIP